MVLGMIFPRRGFASEGWSEVWGDFPLLCNEDRDVFGGRPLLAPNPVNSSSWRKTEVQN